MATNVSNIVGLPLFTGLTRVELTEIANDTSFHMNHIKKGGVIVEAESPCTSLCFITQGWFDVTTVSDDNTYAITETMQPTYCMEPDKLFGLHQRYHSQYVALVPCEVISIDKEEIMTLISKYLIVRLNYLNMICRMSQQSEHTVWRYTPSEIRERLIHFIKCHCLYPAGRKVLHITMNQMAKELNAGRLEVSNNLNDLADKEKIILKRGLMEIPALQLL